MNAKHLIATLALTFAAGIAFAALKHAPADASQPAVAEDCADTAQPAIPRVVITARRDGVQAVEAPVARVIVTGRRG